VGRKTKKNFVLHKYIVKRYIIWGSGDEKMAYLTLASHTEKSVVSSRMLKPGGGVGVGVYTRARKNTISSPGLLRRMAEAAAQMQACRLPDACTTNPKLVGTMRNGKEVRLCSPEEAANRLEAARACAQAALSGAR